MRGGRSSAAIPDVEVRPEIETRPEPEVGDPAEIEVSVSTICEGDLGATGPITADKLSEIAVTVSRYVYRVIDQKLEFLPRLWLVRKITQNPLSTLAAAQTLTFT